MKTDLLILGGGVMGLSVAFSAALENRSVVVADLQKIQPQTSWAGAGIIPPTNRETALEPLEQLRAISNEMHHQWARRLKEISGIDNELDRCGSIYAARTAGELAALIGLEDQWSCEQIDFENCDLERVRHLFPDAGKAFYQQTVKRWTHVPGECRIRNPRHLAALTESCARLGVRFLGLRESPNYEFAKNRVERLVVDRDSWSAEHFCFTGGSWAQEMLEPLDVHISMTPVRGQMLLFKLDQPQFDKIIYDGSLYLVPRTDGHVLAGATVEEAGFDNSTTSEGISNLSNFAARWFPQLNESTRLRSWAGLRPATNDGFPYIGRLPGFENAYVAAGHFRSGIQLSTGTALVINQLIRDEIPAVDLQQFNPARG